MLTRFTIAEGSMRPALRPGEFVVAIRTKRRPHRGEIIVYERQPGFFIVKRVIGLPTETVRLAEGAVWIDGSRLEEQKATDGYLTVALGENEVFVLGDVRSASDGDSRQIGPVTIQPFWWRIAWRYWPLDRLGAVS